MRLSKEFGIPTPYTSLLVEEPREYQRRAGINGPVDRGAGGPGGIGGGGGYGGAPGYGGQPAAPAPPGLYAFGGRDSASSGGFQQQTGANAIAASKAVKDLKMAEVEANGGGIRRVEVTRFTAGWLLLAAALGPPFDILAERSFAAVTTPGRADVIRR